MPSHRTSTAKGPILPWNGLSLISVSERRAVQGSYGEMVLLLSS